MQVRRWIAINLVLLTAFARVTAAQSTDAGRKVFTLEGAVNFALKNYPAVRASLERVTAAQAGVGLARTNYLPRADVVWQTNRATDNNITGLLLPQSIIAPISGPVPAMTSSIVSSRRGRSRRNRSADPRISRSASAGLRRRLRAPPSPMPGE